MIQPGTVIKGFVVRELIGSGGFGDVYRVRDVKSNRPFALKLSRSSLTGHRNWQQVLESFINEVSLVSMLQDNRFIAKVYRSILYKNQTGDYLGIVMELVQGIPLDLYIYNKGKLVHDQAIPLFLQILDAVRHAHASGILHRDIKPGNIMVLTNKTVAIGDKVVHPIKMLDFGLAKTMEQAAAPESLSGVSLPYMAPERLVPGGRIDVRTDIYSLGATLYEMLTGSQPFQITTFPEALSMIPAIRPPSIQASYSFHPDWLDAVVHRAMAKAPERRFPDCTCFARTLGQQESPPAYPPTAPRDAIQAATGPAPITPTPALSHFNWDRMLPGARSRPMEWFLQRILRVNGSFPQRSTGLVPTNIGHRAIAFLIDLAVLATLTILLSRLGLKHLNNSVRPAVLFFACLLYVTGFEAWWGATFGKFCAGLRVVRMRHDRGLHPSTVQILFRTLTKYPILAAFPLHYVSWSPLGISYCWIIFFFATLQFVATSMDIIFITDTKSGLSLHDALAQTLVARRLSKPVATSF